MSQLFPRLRYSVRTLLVILTLLCLLVGWKASLVRRQRSAVATVLEAGGRVEYDYRFKRIHNDSWVQFEAEPPGPKWLRRLLGDDYFTSIIGVSLTDARESAVHETMAAVGNLASLRFLDVQNQSLSDEDVVYLQGLTQLEELDLSGTEVTDEGLRHLARLDNLVRLNLNDTDVSDNGLRNARIGNKHRLRLLGLNCTQVSDEVLHLVEGLAKLELIGCCQTNVTDVAIQEFRERCQQVEVVHLVP